MEGSGADGGGGGGGVVGRRACYGRRPTTEVVQQNRFPLSLSFIPFTGFLPGSTGFYQVLLGFT